MYLIRLFALCLSLLLTLPAWAARELSWDDLAVSTFTACPRRNTTA